MHKSPTANRIEELFSALVAEEKISIISHGVALRLSELQKRHFLAEEKVHKYEEKYHTSLADLEANGLPDDATYEMHEDYIMWHHWKEVLIDTEARIQSLRGIAEQGLYAGDLPHAGE
jgi:hypothetical protein